MVMVEYMENVKLGMLDGFLTRNHQKSLKSLFSRNKSPNANDNGDDDQDSPSSAALNSPKSIPQLSPFANSVVSRCSKSVFLPLPVSLLFFFFIDMNMLLCYLFIFYFFLFTWIAREASSLPFPLQACPLSKNQHRIWFGLHLFCQFHPIMWLHPSFYINFFFYTCSSLIWFSHAGAGVWILQIIYPNESLRSLIFLVHNYYLDDAKRKIKYMFFLLFLPLLLLSSSLLSSSSNAKTLHPWNP